MPLEPTPIPIKPKWKSVRGKPNEETDDSRESEEPPIYRVRESAGGAMAMYLESLVVPEADWAKGLHDLFKEMSEAHG